MRKLIHWFIESLQKMNLWFTPKFFIESMNK